MERTEELLRKLNIKYPIIQGPFGGGFSTVALASAVSNAGGLGSFGAHNLSPDKIVETVAAIRAKTPGSFGMNLWVSSEDPELASLDDATFARITSEYREYFESLKIAVPPFPQSFGEKFEEQVEALIEAKPPVFSFVFGIPSADILERCRRAGIVTVGAATTVEEAVALEEAGVDAVVVTGFEAGGHRPSFLRSAEQSLMGMASLVPAVREKINLPLIAAGGIGNVAGIRAARLLGADAVQLGTAFLACEESGASDRHREAIFSDRARHTILSRHYSGRLARFIENDFITKTAKLQLPYLPYPAQNYFLSGFKKAATEAGSADLAPHYAGQGAPLLKHRRVADLMTALVHEWAEEV